MNIHEQLQDDFQKAQKVCPPDEFELRQRKLLWTLARYVLGPEDSEEEHVKLRINDQTKMPT